MFWIDRLRKVAKTFDDVPSCVQPSVFEIRMRRTRAEIVGQCIAVLLGPGGRRRLYALGARGEQRHRVQGGATPFEGAEGFWMV